MKQSLKFTVSVALTVFNNCGTFSELQKLIIMSKEIQVQVESIKPKQNVVELKLL